MRRNLLTGAAAAGLLAFSGVAFAEGWYVGGMVGGNWLGQVDYDEPINLFNPDPLTFKSGIAGSATVGFMLTPGFRLEGELTGRNNTFDISGLFEGNVSGNAHIFAVMANGWYDFNPIGQFRPYIGGGIGVASVKVHLVNTDDNNDDVDGSKTAFAYQLGAGVGYALTNGITLSLDYRFLGTTSVYIPAQEGDPYGVSGPFYNHSLMVGARFDLGSLIPPPP